MDLVWAKFNKAKSAKYILFILVGQQGGKSVLLMSDKVPPKEAHILRKNHLEIESLPINRRKTWMKDWMPISYKNAYREIPTEKLTIKSRYPIKS